MVKPNRLDHVVINVTDLDRAVAFYTENFGLKVSGQHEGTIVWMNFGQYDENGLYIHDFGVYKVGAELPDNRRDMAGLNHIALHYESEQALRDAADELAANGVKILKGPGTHHEDATHYVYVEDPDRNVIELVAPPVPTTRRPEASTMARLDPLDPEAYGDLAEPFAASEKAVGFVTNNLRIMARRPEITRALMGLFGAVMMAPGTVPKELKLLLGYMASFASGCMYCSAHTGHNAAKQGESTDRIEAVWEFETSPLFTDAERAALRVARLAGQVPNGVTDEEFDGLKQHYTEDQIVEIVAAISLYGFFNRFNDTMATPLEASATGFAEETLGPAGWRVGKHG